MAYFVCGVAHDKCQGTIYKGPKGSLTIFVQAIRSFLQDLRSREPTFSKKGHLPGDKRFWTIFSRIIECDKPQGTICKGLTGNLTITVKVIRSFL